MCNLKCNKNKQAEVLIERIFDVANDVITITQYLGFYI